MIYVQEKAYAILNLAHILFKAKQHPYSLRILDRSDIHMQKIETKTQT